MKSPLLKKLLLATLVVPLSGCPPLTVGLGVWLFAYSETYDSPETAYAVMGLILLEGGGVAVPDPRPEGATDDYPAF